MDSMLPSSGIWAAAGSAVILLIGGAYKAVRMIKGDIREDKTLSNLDKFAERQTARVKDLEEQLEKMSTSKDERIDKLLNDKNALSELTGKLQGEIMGLNTRIEDLTHIKDTEIARLKEDIAQYKEDLTKARKTNEKLLIAAGFDKKYLLEKD